jgi:hypothetical protein
MKAVMNILTCGEKVHLVSTVCHVLCPEFGWTQLATTATTNDVVFLFMAPVSFSKFAFGLWLKPTTIRVNPGPMDGNHFKSCVGR